MTTSNEVNDTYLHAYSRRQAIDDGVLIEADSLEAGIARAAGLTAHVALTTAAWTRTVAWDNQDEALWSSPTGQDIKGRLWDVLTMARHAALGNRDADRVQFLVAHIDPQVRGVEPTLTQLVIHIGPGDQNEPVITIMLPTED